MRDIRAPYLLTAILLAAPAARSEGAATVKTGTCQFGLQTLSSLVLENDFLALTIVPDRGGRIVSWVDKKQGNVNVANLPGDSAEPNYGGLLDDHGWASTEAGLGDFYNYHFAYELKSTGPREVVVELWPSEQTIYRRTLTIRADSPLVKIEYFFTNHSQEDGGNILIRNVIWPSGEPDPEDHLYSTPLTSGVRVDGQYVNTAQGANCKAVAASWRAFGSIRQKRLVAFAFADDLFEGAYDWEGSRTRPSFEWYYRGVPAGKTVRTTLWAYLAHAFSKAVHVSETMVADLEPVRREGRVEIGWAVAAMDSSLKEATLETVIADLAGKEICRLADIRLAALEVDERREGKLVWDSRDPRPVVIRQTVRSGDRCIARYELPFELGGDVYERRVERPAKAELTDIQGWQRVPPLVIKVGAEDRTQGFMIYQADGPQKGESCRQLSLDLGVGEYESLEVRFKTLGEIGTNVTVTAELPAGLPSHALTATGADEIKIAVIWGREKFGWRLSGTNQFAPRQDKDARFWLIANSAGVEPGTYSVILRLTPAQGVALAIPVKLKIWPVKLPDDRHYFLEANSQFNQLGQDAKIRGGVRRWEWNIPAAEIYADDFFAHGGRMVTAYAYGTAPGLSYVSMKLRGDGRFLDEALKADASWLNREGTLPALDLSFWDPWLQIWIDRGFSRYTSGYLSGGVEGYWQMHAGLATQYKAADPQKIRRWFMGETARYLKEKGYRHVYGCIGDEIAPDIFDEWKKAAADARECGWSPGVTLSSSFFRNPPIYTNAGPLMDYWVIGNPEAKLVQKARQDGFITQADSVGSYDGWGTRFREYGHMRAALWKYVLNDMDVFWVQCYVRNHVESIVFNEHGIPYSSAAWEGVRDGCEDGNYLKGALGMLKLLRKSPQHAAAEVFSNRLDRLVAGIDKDDASTLRTAKTELLQLMLDIRKTLPAVQPSLLWEDLPIIEAGRPQYTLTASASGQAAAEQFAQSVARKTGIKMTLAATGETATSDLLLFGHPDDNPLLAKLAGDGVDLGVTSCYPALETYIIRELTVNNRRVIAVIGKDQGLLLGANNLFKMLKLNPDFPNQYFASE